MTETIELTIQEIVTDFEKLARFDERLKINFDFSRATDEDIREFFSFVEKLTRKYIPNYEDYLDDDFEDDDDYSKALTLYNMIYENFREMFYRLV